MLGMFCKSPINAILRGITSSNIDPSVDHIKTSMLSTIKRFILDDEGLDLIINKRGNYEKNGQRWLATISWLYHNQAGFQ